MLTVVKRLGAIIDGRPRCEWVIRYGETPVAVSLSYVRATEIAAELRRKFRRTITPDAPGRRRPVTAAEAVRDARLTRSEGLRYGHLEFVLKVQKQTR